MLNKYNNINNSKGFTLIEIIASISILGIVIVVFLPIFPQIMTWNNNTEKELVAGNLLEQAIHDLKGQESIVSQLEEEKIPVCPLTKKVLPDTELLSYKLNKVSHSIVLNVCQTTEEAKLGLYRTNIQIVSQNDKLSETYTYLQGDAQ
ncbi:type II secretion system protein [Virgibacillus sp. DJP39]|uniref:type II secretion system protein n=1 Tax=Virgibacillus sp. DJP39 TaxID=3409790 RepID=UPI003BB764EF